MKLFPLLIITLNLLVDFGCTLSLDPVASADLEQFIKDDFAISMRHIRPRRKFQILIEALFVIDFPILKHKFSFFLDRKQSRVTLDIGENSVTHSKHFEINGMNETSTIRSLAILFQGNTMTLFVDCKESSKLDIDIGLTKLYHQMDEPIVKLFRERKYPLHFDSAIERAFGRVNCQKANHRRGNRKLLRNKQTEKEKEKNKKRDIRVYYQDEPAAAADTNNNDIQRRGDIPVIHGDCDDALTRAIQELTAIVKQLRDDIAYQRTEIGHLRHIIENCAGCRERPEPLRERCENANPCFPGVQCYDTASGIRCGHCPRGYIGDGKVCKHGITCADRPCFQGVQCHDTIEGAQCDSCPSGYEGDGRTCTQINPCHHHPCASGMRITGPSANMHSYQRQYSSRKMTVIRN